MAIACLRLFTFLPDRPDLSVPRFRSCMARPTFLLAPLLYRRLLRFFDAIPYLQEHDLTASQHSSNEHADQEDRGPFARSARCLLPRWT